VARAQTWLLRAGWRRHGLIRSDEVPGARGAAPAAGSDPAEQPHSDT
jgi:hypothetical protein